MARMRSLLIVDDHGAFRAWAHEVLAHEGFRVLGEAADGASAIEAVDALDPDVVLLDIQLPDISGFEVAERISDRTTVVLTSSRSAADYGERLRRSSAAGFVPKANLTGAAVEAIVLGSTQ
jgi:DNA-binding NarL/FixJ family response regulator